MWCLCNKDYLHCSHSKCLKKKKSLINFELEQANDSNSVKLKSNSYNNDDEDDSDNDDNNNKQQ